MAGVDETLTFFKDHGFHVALIGYSKHGKTFVASTLASLFKSVDILDTDGGMMSAHKQLKDVPVVNYKECWGLVDLGKKIEESEASCIILDSLSSAMDQTKLDSQQSNKTTKLGNDPGSMEHARVANMAFTNVCQIISYACRYRKKVIISLCGVEEDWRGIGEQRKYVGFRPAISGRSALKYAHIGDIYAGQVREPTLIKDLETNSVSSDYSKLRYLTVIKPTAVWPFVGIRGHASFTEKLPAQIENFNLSHFLRAYVYDFHN